MYYSFKTVFSIFGHAYSLTSMHMRRKERKGESEQVLSGVTVMNEWRFHSQWSPVCGGVTLLKPVMSVTWWHQSNRFMGCYVDSADGGWVHLTKRVLGWMLYLVCLWWSCDISVFPWILILPTNDVLAHSDGFGTFIWQNLTRINRQSLPLLHNWSSFQKGPV
jgi:hypothetical protein